MDYSNYYSFWFVACVWNLCSVSHWNRSPNRHYIKIPMTLTQLCRTPQFLPILAIALRGTVWLFAIEGEIVHRGTAKKSARFPRIR